MKNWFLIIGMLFSIDFIGQNTKDTIIMFNNKLPYNGDTYYFSDILNTDTLKTNIKGLKILEFYCSSVCDIDWEVRGDKNLLTQRQKNLITYCAGKQSDEFYVMNVVLINKKSDTATINYRTYKILKE